MRDSETLNIDWSACGETSDFHLVSGQGWKGCKKCCREIGTGGAIVVSEASEILLMLWRSCNW